MKKSQRFVVYLVVGAVVLIIISQFSFMNKPRDITRKIFTAPFGFFNSLIQKSGTGFKIIGSINNLSSENADFKDKVSQLQSELGKLQTVSLENEELRKQLAFAQTRTDLKMISTNVIGYSPVRYYNTVIINKGSDDGLREGMVAVNSGFLLGKITKTSSHTSEVTLITSRNLVVPVLLPKSQATGLLTGGISGLTVDNLPLDAKVSKDDIVVTTNMEGLYPSGIAIGTVEEISSSSQGIFQTLKVSTPVDINKLSSVFVVINQ